MIVVCTNELRHLVRCLPSLLNQDHPCYEIVVVDNASSDGSNEYVRSLQPNHSQLRLIINKENLGYAGANNVGFADTAADLVVVLNPDTEAEPDWLSELTRVFDDPEIGLATSKIVMMNDRGCLNTCGNDMSVLSLVVCRGLGQPSTSFNEPTDVAAVSGAAFAIRRSVLDEVGPFDPSFFTYYEDTDLSLRVRLAGYRCVYTPSSVVAHDYIFKFTARKAFWQERNRSYTLLKTFRWRTLLVMSPWLVLGDLVALCYCVLQGPAHVLGKLRAYAWILSNWRSIMEGRRRTQALRAVPDARLLKALVPEISLAGAAEGWLRSVVETSLRPLLRLGCAVSRQVTW